MEKLRKNSESYNEDRCFKKFLNQNLNKSMKLFWRSLAENNFTDHCWELMLNSNLNVKLPNFQKFLWETKKIKLMSTWWTFSYAYFLATILIRAVGAFNNSSGDTVLVNMEQWNST